MPPVLFAWPNETNSSRPHTLFRWTERSETESTATESVGTDTTESPQTTLQGISIIAFVSGLILLGIAIWLVARFLRRRVQEERVTKRGAAFLSMRGLVKESESMVQNREKRLSELPISQKDLRSTNPQPPCLIATPQRAHIPSAASLDEIIKYYMGSDQLPRPFGVIPGSLRPASRPLSTSPLSTMLFPVSGASPSPRSSFTSIAGDQIATFRTPPDSPLTFDRSALNSGNSTPTQLQGETRKVCQIFTAVLPDELQLNRFGELLMIVRSFDDGWCLVGRVKGNPTYHLSPMSLFKFPHPDAHSRGSEGVVLGVVPAWCFVMPCKGVRAERPIRNSSLGITVEVDVAKTRNDIRS